ncbi:hypothetical protein FE392_07210 [Xenorhabdus sp. 12]|uniref:Uncharacterized protein n=1 Tax=Xenorhabdus santafensis TaxID=2582833 RepID=A0ABU4S8K3_9GAMM|nr:hypothetical protein [Xenorhabdus sp. 12]MDX7987119.1 hypothetical protein [Xenorhabdus sp. 12]
MDFLREVISIIHFMITCILEMLGRLFIKMLKEILKEIFNFLVIVAIFSLLIAYGLKGFGILLLAGVAYCSYKFRKEIKRYLENKKVFDYFKSKRWW